MTVVQAAAVIVINLAVYLSHFFAAGQFPSPSVNLHSPWATHTYA